MSLLQEIIDGASGDQMPVASLLRKVKVLAARIDTAKLDEWVENELSGYKEGNEIPAYRGPFRVEVLGHFAGPFGSGVQNAPIPPVCFPEKLRDSDLFYLSFSQPIVELESLSKSEKPLHASWDADSIAFTNLMIERGDVRAYPSMGLMQAWRQISPQHLQGIVDTVRTRTLDLALAFEKISPRIGEQGGPVPEREPAQSIINNIYGGSNNLAIQSHDVTQSASVVGRGDESGLLAAVAATGVEKAEVEELRQALADDRAQAGGSDPAEPGPKVRGWLGKISLGTASVGGKIATSAAGGVIATLIKSYFGL
ncbi:hypothetical protein [Lentzea sp. NPDC051838]|uniref:AbiTii domain-containing protein n=1 Tax=Lentzea sp. NPDC051838 TaxID=3154849 RepID=UPI003414A306